jgi:hypothetical protein
MRFILAMTRTSLAVAAKLIPSLAIIGLLGSGAIAGDGARRSGPPLPAGLEVGQPFPEIALPSAEDGRPLSLARFRGMKTILHVFASW